MAEELKLSKADCNIPMSQEESKEVQIEMLDTLVAFCEQNDLRYSLSGGTLLGAIRHKGFIPWDDDIDVNMPRPDYEKLFQLTNGKLEHYRLEGPDQGLYLNSCNWARLYNDDTVMENMKKGIKSDPWYHPIFIDIFPVDGLPNGKIQRYLHWYKIIFYTKMRRSASLNHMEAKTVYNHIFHVVSALPAKLIGYNRWERAIQRCATRYSFDEKEFVGVVVTTQYITKEIIRKDEFLKSIKVTFEGKEYSAPSNYDTYLSHLYGDYMTIPPKEEQTSGHVFNMFWKIKL